MVGAEGHEVATAAASKSNNALDLVPACIGHLLVLAVVRRRRFEPHKAMLAFCELPGGPLALLGKQVSKPDLLYLQASPLEGVGGAGVVGQDKYPAALGNVNGLCREGAVLLLGGRG